MKVRRQHISRLLAIFLLCVFAIALTPWSSLHHHQDEQQETCVRKDGQCHQFHVSKQQHNCLVCSAHFEKDYHSNTEVVFSVIDSQYHTYSSLVLGSSYTALISESLRGPPSDMV